jgi:hypothetical protein
MKKKIRYVLVGALTFGLGVLLSPIHFRWYSVSCGFRYSATRYTSSPYSLELTTTGTLFDSVEEASEAWNKEVNRAISVIEQTPVLSRDGQRIGSRAVLILKRDDGKQYYGVVWTEEKSLRGIDCSSLWHIYSFQKQHY